MKSETGRISDSSISTVSAARIRPDQLEMLAGFRARADVEVAQVETDSHLWIRWPAGDMSLTLCMLAAPGVELYRIEEEEWYRAGSFLPSRVNPPAASDYRPLHRALLPARVEWEAPPDQTRAQALRLQPDDRPKPTTAIRASASDLLAWAESVPSSMLRLIEAAIDEDQVLLLGPNLPLTEGERWWGGRVLCPLARRPEPDLSDAFLASALGLNMGQRALLREEGHGVSAEVLPAEAFRPLSREGLRRASSGGGG